MKLITFIVLALCILSVFSGKVRHHHKRNSAKDADTAATTATDGTTTTAATDGTTTTAATDGTTTTIATDGTTTTTATDGTTTTAATDGTTAGASYDWNGDGVIDAADLAIEEEMDKFDAWYYTIDKSTQDFWDCLIRVDEGFNQAWSKQYNKTIKALNNTDDEDKIDQILDKLDKFEKDADILRDCVGYDDGYLDCSEDDEDCDEFVNEACYFDNNISKQEAEACFFLCEPFDNAAPPIKNYYKKMKKCGEPLPPDTANDTTTTAATDGTTTTAATDGTTTTAATDGTTTAATDGTTTAATDGTTTAATDGTTTTAVTAAH